MQSTAKIYEQWSNEGGKPPSLVCCKTGTDIIDDIETLKDKAKENYYANQRYMYYMLYLETVIPEDTICYSLYQRDIARDFEKKQRAEFINPVNKEVSEDYNKLMNIPKRFWDVTFDTNKDEPQQRAMLEKVNTFIEQGYTGTLLLSTPQYGFGKTNFQVCIVKQYFVENDVRIVRRFMDNKWSMFSVLNTNIMFATELQLYNLLRRTFEGFLPEDRCPYSEQQVYDALNNMDLLVISDVFQDHNELKKRMMTTIIEQRVDEQCKNLVLSTNMQINFISQRMQYVYSRLRRGLIFATTGKEQTIDLRTKYK